MKIIPVMDILDGVVVHAVKGIRSNYKPIKSVLSDSANPLNVASAFKSCGFDKLYLADLDAIMGKDLNYPLFRQISNNTGLELWVDAGFDDLRKAEEAVKNHVSKIIVGTETLPLLSFIEDAIKLLGNAKVVVSLDLMGQTVISRSKVADQKDPKSLVHEFQAMGVTQLIVLDIGRVGSENGVNLSTLQATLGNPNLKVFVGGGVRNIKDLLEIKNLGASGVLLATALHTGKITLEELKHAGLLE